MFVSVCVRVRCPPEGRGFVHRPPNCRCRSLRREARTLLPPAGRKSTRLTLQTLHRKSVRKHLSIWLHLHGFKCFRTKWERESRFSSINSLDASVDLRRIVTKMSITSWPLCASVLNSHAKMGLSLQSCHTNVTAHRWRGGWWAMIHGYRRRTQPVQSLHIHCDSRHMTVGAPLVMLMICGYDVEDVTRENRHKLQRGWIRDEGFL